MGRKNHCACFGKKGRALLCITALIIVSLCGCTLKSEYQKETENTQGEMDVYQKIELSEKEMDQSHFTLDDFKKTVKIDANITPYHLYKDGVGTYYNPNGRMWNPDSNVIKLDKKVKDAKPDDFTYFGKSVEEITKILKIKNGRKPQLKKMKWKFEKKYGMHWISIPFATEENEEDSTLEIRWESVDKEDNPLLNSKKLYCYSFHMSSGSGQQAKNLVNSIQLNHDAPAILSNTEKSLSFADSGATAQMLKEMLTELTGYKYSEEYEVIPINPAMLDTSSENIKQLHRNLIKPCYYYRFYQELDKLPIRGSGDSILVNKETNLSEELRKEMDDETDDGTSFWKTQIDHYCSPYVEIIYDDTGISFLQFGTDFVSDEEPIGEKKSVMNLSDILEPLYEHFDSVVSIDTTVYEIRLGYRAAFTDGENEPIRRILTPTWIVKYDTQITGKRSQVVCFDGYTGMPLEHLNIIWY